MRHPAAIRLRLRCVLAAAACGVAFAAPSHACRIYVRPNFEDVKYADVVVVGRISNYRIVRDEAFRRRMLASPRLSADMRRIYEDPRQGLMGDNAHFDILVDEVLVGRASRRLSVIWDNSTYGEPDHMPSGSYLIALRRPASPTLPLRGPRATIMPSSDPNVLTPLQAPCSSASIHEVGSEQARIVRRIVASRSR